MDDLIQFNSPPTPHPSTSKVFPSIDDQIEKNQLSVMDLERESLGVLPDNFFANRSFLNISDIGMESLGILNMSNNNFLFGRPSISALNDSFLGRESLGILNLQALMETNSKNKVPDLILTLDTETCETGSILKPKLSTLSSTTSFHSNSLEGPSRIYSVSSSTKDQSDDIFNNAIFNSADFIAKLMDNDTSALNKAKIFDSTELKSPLEDDNANQAFYDNIYQEAKEVASRIADCSLLVDDDSVFLDSTAPPEELLDISGPQIEDDQPKVDTDSVFKTVDKLLASVPTNNFDIKTKQRSKSAPVPTIPTVDNISAISQISNPSNDSKKSQNHSILQDSRRSTTSSNNKSKDTKEIIQNLSEILNNSRRSDVQKSEGHQMLENLANLLCNSSIQSLEDSGHSSVMIDEAVVEETIDLGNSSGNFIGNQLESSPQPLNLSLKKEIREERRLSQSFCAPSTSKIIPKCVINVSSGSDKNSSQKSFGKNLTHNSLSTSSIAGKLRCNKNEVKRGPMKAVLPINNVAKIEIDKTPKKSTLKPSIPVCYKRTSTPIHDPKMKPMAASTPTARGNTSKEIGTSPICRPRSSSITDNKRHTLHTTPVRRNSITEAKGTPTLKRSFSTGTSGINSVLSQVRHNISLNIKENANNGNKSSSSKITKFGMSFKSRLGKENAV